MQTRRFATHRSDSCSQRKRHVSLTVLLLVILLTGASGAEHFKGRCEASVLLGSERWPEVKQRYSERRQLLKEGRLNAAISVQREIADLQCHNHFHRYYLAELLTQAGRPGAAVEVLEELYALGVNDLEERLTTDGSALHPILASEAFTGSRLAQEMEAKRVITDARRALARARLEALTPDERPPQRYIAHGACPFECCNYRSWSVLEDTPLVAQPGSHEVIAIAHKGTYVDGLTGEVHVTPGAVSVVYPEPAYAPNAKLRTGSIVFLLDHLGEGLDHVWNAGTIHEVSTSGEVQSHCPFPTDDCWGEALTPDALDRDAVWWVKVRLGDGSEGWTREIHFGGIDACG